ncbi:acid protease [Trametes elegans]|nr:acid protease [Trametes elegans]
MFCKTTLITVALALLSSATPILRDEPAPVAGIRVPLQKRGSLKTADGVFSYEKAVREIVKLQNKHRQNLLNIQANLGVEGLPLGAEIKALATLPVSLLNSVLGSRGAVPLTDQDSDLEWTGPIAIGTPGRNYTIDFDTGSADLWVPGSTCTTCGNHTLYDPAASSTGAKQNGSFSIQYGDGSTASGAVFTDTGIHRRGIAVPGQVFAAVANESSKPFFINAIEQGAAPEGVFAFKLDQAGSELFVGGTNPDLYTGDIEFHNLSSQAGFWQIGGASVSVGGTETASEFETIIDSGSTIITAPTAAAKAFWAKVPEATVYDEDQGLWALPCDKIPDVAFSWGGNTWTVKAEDINAGQIEAGSDTCVGAIAGADLGLGNNTWLLGDTFMKSVYTVFSVDRKAIGFASLA